MRNIFKYVQRFFTETSNKSVESGNTGLMKTRFYMACEKQL